jgi:hypothetical protein
VVSKRAGWTREGALVWNYSGNSRLESWGTVREQVT